MPRCASAAFAAARCCISTLLTSETGSATYKPDFDDLLKMSVKGFRECQRRPVLQSPWDGIVKSKNRDSVNFQETATLS